MNTYENSQKAEHRKFLRFVALRLDESPAGTTNVKKKTEPYLSHSAQVSGPSVMAKPVSSTDWDPEEHQLEEILAHQENQDLRMSRIESALTSIIKHLEHQAVTQQEPMNPWTMVKEEPN